MNPFLGRAAGRWFRSSRPRRGRAGFAAGVAGVERLEGRVLLTAGDLRWEVSRIDNFSGGEDYRKVAVQADGKIVVVGTAHFGGDNDFVVARYTADGRPDQSFGGIGRVAVNFTQGGGPKREDRGYDLAVQADGKIVVVGESYVINGEDAEDYRLAMARLNRDGSLDTTYGGGKVLDSSVSSPNSVALAADGGIFVGAFSNRAAVVLKLNAGGGRDNGFNGTGVRDMPAGTGGVNGLAVDGGRVVAALSDGTVVRLTSAGAFDNTFSDDGVAYATFDHTAQMSLQGVAVLPDHRIVVGGWSHNGTHYLPGVARLIGEGPNAGSYDNTFDGNGRYSFDPVAGQHDYLRDIAVLANGGVVAAGYDAAALGDGWVAVLTPSGVRDSGFAGDGVATWVAGARDEIHGLAVTPEGHYAVAGSQGEFSTKTAGVALFEGRFGRRDDLLGWAGTGDWYAAGSTGTAFGTAYFGRWNRNAGWKTVETADLDGDGDADLLGRDGTGQWWVGRNTGSAFATVAGAKWNEAAGWGDLRLADFDGDGRSDVAARTSTGQWWVSRSTGTGLANGTLWAKWNEGAQWRDVLAADFDGDGRADLAGRTSGGQWYVGLSTGAGFTLALWDTWAAGGGWRDVMAGDFDGDGRQDIAGRASNGQWWVSRSTGLSFAKSQWGTWGANAGWTDVGVGDFDRDGRTDVAGRASNGQWYVGFARDGNTFSTAAWGKWNPGAGWRDVTIGDYDGDGRADFAGRTSGGEWYVTRWEDGPVVTARWGRWNEAAGWTAFGGELVRTG